MQIRKATAADLETVMTIYRHAQAYMVENGNPNQWAVGYPDEARIALDIQQEKCHVCEEAGAILGVFYCAVEADPTYAVIYDGAWASDAPYAVMHRLAVGVHRRGVAGYCLRWCLEQYHNVRIDTYRDNRPMLSLLEKNGFTYCGRILLANGSPRLAFQRTAD